MSTPDLTPVLVSAKRTSVGRINSRFADKTAVDLGAAAVAGALAATPGIPIDYVALANVVQAGNGQNPARIAAVRGGVTRSTPGITLNDVCLGSLSAVAFASQGIRAGEWQAVLVGGFDSMSNAPRKPVDLLVHDGLWCSLDQIGMGELSDSENQRLAVSRSDQDEWSLRSHLLAAAATSSGRIRQEIVDGEFGGDDEGIRRDTSLARLAGLPPAFTPTGTITAGNASQMSDAGAAGVVTSRQRALQVGHEPLIEIVGRAVVAGENSSLHLQPADAARAVLSRHGLNPGDVGLWEINEAFAGVVLASMRSLRIDEHQVNVNGGAIAVGHPLGASGFRLLTTLSNEMRMRDVEWGIATMCGGGGQGEALLVRRAG